MPNTYVVDDRPTAKSSAAEASVVAHVAASTRAPHAGASIKPSSAKSSRMTRSRSSETEGIVNVPLLADRSAYSDPSFVKEVDDALLLPAV